jgi:hypothetical protein
VIFDNELSSGGGAFLYPGGENQTLSFADRSNPLSQRSIRYSWNGGDVSWPGCSPNPEHSFAGLDLMHTPTQTQYNSTPGRDLRQGGYNKVTFFARGSLASYTVLKIEVASPGVPAGTCPGVVSPCLILSSDGVTTDPGSPTCPADPKPLTGQWQQYTINVAPSNLTSVKDFFKATFIFENLPGCVPSVCTAPGQGGTVYFDVIQYQP